MAKHFEVGEYVIEINRQGNRSESEFVWTVYTHGVVVRSGRAEGPHEARAAAELVCGVVPQSNTERIGRALADSVNETLRVMEAEFENCQVALTEPLSRWQRFKAWLASYWASLRWI